MPLRPTIMLRYEVDAGGAGFREPRHAAGLEKGERRAAAKRRTCAEGRIAEQDESAGERAVGIDQPTATVNEASERVWPIDRPSRGDPGSRERHGAHEAIEQFADEKASAQGIA